MMEGSSSRVTSLPGYKLGKTLGFGSFSKVKLAEHVLTGHKVAIKIVDCRNKAAEESARREIKIMRVLAHPHILRLYEAIETANHIYIVMEYVQNGELFYYITENGRLQDDEARRIFQQIIAGVEYCHMNMIVHRDLKPENLLLDSKCNVKIADFGFSNIMRDGHFLKRSCGSPNYAAPEIISGNYVGNGVDVWSCGVILYALLCGTLPFDGEGPADILKMITAGVYTLPSLLSPGARDLIQKILVVDPMKRISIPQIRQHPWFQAHLPRYLAVSQPVTMQLPQKNIIQIDEAILQEVIKMGIDRNELVDFLRNRLENQYTVAYHLLLDNQSCASSGYLETELEKNVETSFLGYPNEAAESSAGDGPPGVFMDYQGLESPSQFPVERKWTVGLQSRAPPRDIMREVLKALQELNVCWKKIGEYNIKCRRVRSTVGHQENGIVGSLHSNYNIEDESSSTTGNNGANVIKFEMQLYKTREEKYLLDLQRLQGSPTFFLDFCDAFLSHLGVI